MITPDQRLELKAYMLGTKIRTADALRDLGISFTDSDVVTAELADTIVRCKQCGYWVDAAIVDDGECASCRE